MWIILLVTKTDACLAPNSAIAFEFRCPKSTISEFIDINFINTNNLQISIPRSIKDRYGSERGKTGRFLNSVIARLKCCSIFFNFLTSFLQLITANQQSVPSSRVNILGTVGLFFFSFKNKFIETTVLIFQSSFLIHNTIYQERSK